VYELTGYPGAGKSHAGERLCDGRTWSLMDGVSKTDPRRGTADRILLSLRFPLVTLLLYALLLSRRGGTVQNLRMAVTIQRRLAFIEGAPGGEGRVLLDEGPVHGLFSVLYGTGPTWLSRYLLDALIARIGRRLAGVIHLTATPAIALENLKSRPPGRSRFNASMAPTDMQAFLDDRVYDELLQSIRRRWPDRLHLAADAGELRQLLDALAAPVGV
jgi:hypothetical protein